MQTLLKSVCSLSYSGDIRIGLAEDPGKISRIVKGSREGLEAIYLPILFGSSHSIHNDTNSHGNSQYSVLDHVQ
jgi:hypothetical protein